ncbi:hypothetical protein PHMEG_00017647 [Phytophthora megakarya]|uniref:Uncharacterized protein n=1 Tax=Phytophthora megakarya TaxID=4795 RepID=A0A225VXX2_9STRA|nr:hypothetical protein PHMEG_00017647 [Phytophthora megakarya]
MRIMSFLDCSNRWTIQKAACSGFLSLLKRLGERNAEITDHGFDTWTAPIDGLFRKQHARLGERNAEITDHGFDWSMRIAATEGYLDIIKWLSAYRPEVKISARVMDAAALRGHLKVLKWLHENRSEGCSLHAMDSAAAGGHLDVVRWLHENRTEGCSTGAMDTAAAGGHLTTVQWLWANRGEGCTTVAVDFAIYNGHFPVVKWFSELTDFQPRTAKHTAGSNNDSNSNVCIKKQRSGQVTLTFD